VNLGVILSSHDHLGFRSSSERHFVFCKERNLNHIIERVKSRVLNVTDNFVLIKLLFWQYS